MPNDEAAPIIIFIASVYAFGIVLLYALARAWEQSLSTRPRRGAAADTRQTLQRPNGRAAGVNNPSTAVSAKVRQEDGRDGPQN